MPGACQKMDALRIRQRVGVMGLLAAEAGKSAHLHACMRLHLTCKRLHSSLYEVACSVCAGDCTYAA